MRARLVDLASGKPPAEFTPYELVQRASALLFDSHAAGEGSGPLDYGDEPTRYRAAVAAFVQRCDQLRETPDPARFVPTAGVSQGLDLALTVLGARASDVVLFEDPGYFLAQQIFSDRGLEVRSVEGDAEGVTAEAVRAAAGGGGARFLYLVPTHSNPRGVTMSLARRRELIATCDELDITILADEVYHQLGFADAPLPPPRFAALSPRALSVSSFAKLVAPGLRAGWIECGDAAMAARFDGSGVALSGGCSSQYTCYLVACALEAGLVDAHVRELRAEFGRRGAALLAALDALDLGARGVAFSRPSGGYFVWMTLPEGCDAKALQALAQEAHGVRVLTGELFSPAGRHTNCVRLCFARLPAEELAEGAARLGRALEEFLPSAPVPSS